MSDDAPTDGRTEETIFTWGAAPLKFGAGETRAERRELMARLLELRDCAGAACR